MFELSEVRVIEWFLWESISESSTGIQKQFDLLEVRVIGGSSYRQCTVIIHEFQATCQKKRSTIVIREFINTLVTFKVAIQCEVQYPHHKYNKTSQWMLYVWLALLFSTSVMFLVETLYCKSSNIFNLTVATDKIHHHSIDISDKIPKILQVDWMRNIWSSWKALLTYLKGFVSKATFWEIWFFLCCLNTLSLSFYLTEPELFQTYCELI